MSRRRDAPSKPVVEESDAPTGSAGGEGVGLAALL
jgi:hypothetical protein